MLKGLGLDLECWGLGLKILALTTSLVVASNAMHNRPRPTTTRQYLKWTVMITMFNHYSFVITIFWKRINHWNEPLAQVVCSTRQWNHRLRSSVGQQSTVKVTEGWNRSNHTWYLQNVWANFAAQVFSCGRDEMIDFAGGLCCIGWLIFCWNFSFILKLNVDG